MRSKALALLVMSVAACSHDGTAIDPRSAQASIDAAAAKTSAELAAQEAKAAQKAIDELELRVRIIELNNSEDFTGWANLDPAGGRSYQVAETNIAPVLVSFTSATPIADGSQVRLQVGNLSTARFGGAELTLRYNKRMPQDEELRGSWFKTQRETTAKISESLVPGTWNVISVSLPGIKPDELGYLSIKVKLDTVFMYEARQPLSPTAP